MAITAGIICLAAATEGLAQSYGSLEVTIYPQAAVNAGARWQVDGGGWQSSGATVSGLTVGQHTVSCSTVSGWTAPAAYPVSVVAKQTTLSSPQYVQQQYGSLEVTIYPQGAVNAGARWQVDGGGWQSSGATVSGLTVGQHTVSCSTVSGWTAPAAYPVSVVANQTTFSSPQ